MQSGYILMKNNYHIRVGAEIMKRELALYCDDWAEDDKLIDAITDIIEDYRL